MQYSLNTLGIFHRLAKINAMFVKIRTKYERGLLNLKCVRLDLKNPEVIWAVYCKWITVMMKCM